MDHGHEEKLYVIPTGWTDNKMCINIEVKVSKSLVTAYNMYNVSYETNCFMYIKIHKWIY